MLCQSKAHAGVFSSKEIKSSMEKATSDILARRDIKITAVAQAVAEDYLVVIIAGAYSHLRHTIVPHYLREAVQRVVQFLRIGPEYSARCPLSASPQHAHTAQCRHLHIRRMVQLFGNRAAGIAPEILREPALRYACMVKIFLPSCQAYWNSSMFSRKRRETLSAI